MLVGKYLNDEKPLKGLRSVPVIYNRVEEEYPGRRGVPGDEGTSMMKTP